MKIRNLFLLFFSLLLSQVYAQLPNLALEVNTPSSISGDVPILGPDGFGPSLFNPTTGDIAWAYSTVDSLICDTVVTDLTDKVALIRRGGCNFTYKIFEAQKAGAVGVIIVNTPNTENYFGMGTGINADSITIPSAMVADSIVQDWMTLLDSGTPVNVTFKIPHIQKLTVYDTKVIPYEFRKPLTHLGFDLIVPNTYTYTMNGTLSYRISQPNNTIVNGTASYSINPNTQGTFNIQLPSPIYPNTVGEYVVEMWSSAALGDTIRNTFTISDHLYAYVDTDIEPKHSSTSNYLYNTPDINGNSYTHHVGILLKTNAVNSAPDSLLVSWGLYNSNEYLNKTFNVHIYEEPAGGFSNNYDGLNSIASTSYTIQPEDTLNKFELFKMKLTSDIWPTDRIVFDQNKDYLLLIESPSNDTTLINPPAYLYQPSPDFIGTNNASTNNTVVFLDQLYMGGWSNKNQAYIVADFAGCNDNTVAYNTQYFCAGDTFTIGSSQFTDTEIDLLVTYSNANSQGCDSIVRLDLIRHPEVDTTFIDYTICSNHSYNFFGNLLNQEGLYEHIETNANGCDVVTQLNLTVNPTSTIYLTDTICSGETYSVGTAHYSTSGNFVFITDNSYGCDSTIHLNLTVLPTHSINISESLCEGEDFTVGGTTYNNTGTYTVTLENSYGCDSVITLNLTINSIDTTYLIEEICEGEEFTVGSNSYAISGSYSELLTSSFGCDSTVFLNLTVNTNDTTYLTEEICQDEEFIIDTDTYNTTGNYSNTLTNIQGCDSVVYLDLTVNPTNTIYLTETICEGEEFTVGASVYTTTGSFSNTLNNMYGCDSTVHLDLTVNLNDTVDLTEEICAGDQFTVSTSIYNTTGLYTDVLTNMYGCDSTVNLNLTVHAVDTIHLIEHICEGDVFTVGTMNYDTTGTYIQVLTNTNGCDSTVNLNLTVNPTPITNLNEEICAGDVFQIGTLSYDTTGNYSTVLSTIHGCDSTVNLTLLVHSNNTTSLTEEICEGDAFSVGNSTYNTTGDFTTTLTNVNGCDSVVDLNLTVHTIDETVTIDQLTLISNQYNASYQWLNCPNYNPVQGANQQTFSPLVDGEYAVEITFNGCVDTSDCIVFSGIGLEEDANNFTSIFPNPFQSTLEITFNNQAVGKRKIMIYNDLGQKMVEVESTGNKNTINTTSFEKGIYYVTIMDDSAVNTFKVIKN